ncbi:ABC transporter permease, partial [Streptomyces sp. MBT60]|nr:ABC transporter permease [Streptomyces sp. MBT60]
MSQAERSRAEKSQAEKSQARRARPSDPQGSRNPLWTLGLLRSEITTLLRRHRTYALLAVLAAVPVSIRTAIPMRTGTAARTASR